jgi:hypothetical protein
MVEMVSTLKKKLSMNEPGRALATAAGSSQ